MNRRAFLSQTGSLIAGTAVATPLASGVFAAEDNTIKVALIGCGGRGTGAAVNALTTKGPVKIYAMADLFEDRLASSHKNLSGQFSGKIDVPPDRRFLGFDGYRKAIDCLDKNDLVLLATPPAFRPLHFEYAVQKGVNIFAEKSFAVDPPGIRRNLRSNEIAKQKNLKVACGFMWRHDPPREEVIRRIHQGEIGDVHTLRTYRMHGAVGFSPKPAGMSELAHQIRNYNSFTWLNGGFYVDWLIHNIDVCCWAKNALPVSAQGMGGRQMRQEADQMFDHYMVEYMFPDGARLFAQARHINNCYEVFSDFAHGSKGSAVIMESLGAANPRIYKGQLQTPENEQWRYRGPTPNPYQVEHDLFFDAIRENKSYNEMDRSARSNLATIMGRLAVYSGKMITYDEALASNREEAPGLDQMSWDSSAPVLPDAQGRYPLPQPGKFQL